MLKVNSNVFAEYKHGGEHWGKRDELGRSGVRGEWGWEQAWTTLLHGFPQTLTFIHSFKKYFFVWNVCISVLGEVQFWEDCLDCDNQQVLKPASKGQHQQDQVMLLVIKLVVVLMRGDCVNKILNYKWLTHSLTHSRSPPEIWGVIS